MKILILHASAGEGHRRAALAIESALVRAGVARQDILTADALDYGAAFFKNSYTGFYYWCVKHIPKAWGIFYDLLDHPVIYQALYPIRRIYNALNGHRLLKTVISEKPSLVICTHFYSAEILGHARKKGQIQSKIVVVVTDFHPVRVWAHDGIDAYWVLSNEAKQTLIQRGTDSEKITAGGFPIMSEFQNRNSFEAVSERFQLEKGRLTILLTTGSFGLGEQMRLLDLLEAEKEKIQCLVVCGRNKILQETLQKKQYGYPVRIFGFVDFMPSLMDAADLMVAKPGGATTAEAMAKGVPMIAIGAIPGQETENLKFLLKHHAVFSAETPEEVKKVIHDILSDRNLLEEKKKAADRISNARAADDIAQMRLKWLP